MDIIGVSAGGRPIWAVHYGESRNGKGTTTFSGSLGFGDIKTYRGPDHEKTVYLGLGGVHGGEFEGIVGIINLISIIESGKDLNGKEWSEITEAVKQIDRIILIPIVNPDGRSRIPLRMQKYRDNALVTEYLNTGGNPDGTLIGYPQIKEMIPLDFNRGGFPGGYPNDAGINIMHDNFFNDIQPETKILFELTEREKPDLILNMHTGGGSFSMMRPFMEVEMFSTFDSLYKNIFTRLANEDLTYNKNIERVIDPSNAKLWKFNLNGALNLHCGALSVTIESPSHGFSAKRGDGTLAFFSPEMILNGQLWCHAEAMSFLVQTGGRSKWTPGIK